MEIRKTFQFLNKKFTLECKVSSNPIEKLYWYRNGAVLNGKDNGNIKVDKYDISNLNEYHKTLLTLTIMVNIYSISFDIFQVFNFDSY